MSTFTHAGGQKDGIVGTTASHNHNGTVGRNDDTTARNAATPEGNGVFGVTQVPDGAGVFGLHEGNGVGIAGFGHPTGIGVVGVSAPAGAKGGDGVLGISNSEHRNGIVGRNDSSTARLTAEPGGNGIFGFTQVPDGAGVFGAHASTGIGVAGLGLIGVSGGSVNGVGVMGVSAPPGGVGAGDGVQGITNSEFRNGIYGRNEATNSRGNGDPVGNGVLGFTNVPDGSGVLGVNGRGGHAITGTGGFGLTGIGTVMGVWGIAKGTAWAGYFSGPVMVEGTSSFADVEISRDLNIAGDASFSGNVSVGGDITVRGDVLLPNKDIAECFEVEDALECSPGTVMVMGDAGVLVPCSRGYDKRAVGVVSGAGTLQAAITLGASVEAAASAKIALVGTAYCRVDADFAPIEIGDLVTTSATVGHGMKASDQSSSFGAIIGKALAPLAYGQGIVPILLSFR
jgi:hypothetical protein